MILARLRAFAWAARAGHTAHRALRRDGLNVTDEVPHQAAAAASARWPELALRLTRRSCLERALVMQRWYAAAGADRDVIIGVTTPSEFQAHAWLEGEEPGGEITFRELLRRPAAGEGRMRPR